MSKAPKTEPMQVVNDPHAQKAGLKVDPTAAEIVEWLKTLTINKDEPKQAMQYMIGELLLTNVFKGDIDDALKPYATLSIKGIKPRAPKYPALVRKSSSAWDNAHQAYTDRESPYYIETLVHAAAVDKWLEKNTDLPQDLSLSHKFAVARCITLKTVSITKKDDSKEDLKELVTRIRSIPESEVISKIDAEISGKLEDRTAASSKTRKEKPSSKQQSSTIIADSLIDAKTLKAIVADAKEATTELVALKKTAVKFIESLDRMHGKLDKEIDFIAKVLERLAK